MQVFRHIRLFGIWGRFFVLTDYGLCRSFFSRFFIFLRALLNSRKNIAYHFYTPQALPDSSARLRHLFDFGSKMTATKYPKTTAAVMPAAVFFMPPVRIPVHPSVSMPSMTPFTRE